MKKYRLPIAIVAAVAFFPLVIFFSYYFGKIYPNVYIDEINVGGKTPEQAVLLIGKNVSTPEKLTLESYEIDLASLDFSYDINHTVQAATAVGRTGNWLFDIKTIFSLLNSKKEIGLRYEIDDEKLTKQLSDIAGGVIVEPIYPSAQIIKKEVVINPGEKGVDVDMPALKLAIGQNLSLAKNSPISIPTKEIDPSLDADELTAFESRVEKFVGKNLTLTFEYQEFFYNDNQLAGLLAPTGGIDEQKLQEEIYEVTKSINREATNPVFVFEGGKVKEFAPAKDGVKVKTDQLKSNFEGKINALETTDEKHFSLTIPALSSPPEIATGSVNDLGIKELIGRGTSRFRGSIASRVYNINLAASRLNGTLVKPGEVMSFNAALGEVDKLTGYKEAYVIKDGKTVLGDGGGVCQVSTTLFRAALNAGLPIIERRAHSYRVGYYEQDQPPGLDATVYAPTTDLKIKNDTPGHILIQATADTKNMTLVFEIYGTSDGRVATTTKPVVTDVVPPPEDLYVDDPTLPAGEIKQIDYKAWGAKSRFNYTVTRDGETIYQKTFNSSYRPWQAIYLKGTGPAN